jgi:Flp pilus assembly protein TadB
MVVRSAQKKRSADAAATAQPDAKNALERNRSALFAAGLGVALLLWIAADRPLLGAAFFAVWQAAFALLRARARSAREREEEQHAVEAISTASRALRAGIPLSGMLQILAAEGRGETGAAFREIVQRESLGEELGTAVRGVLLRSPIPALRAFGLSIAVQVSAGGNLAETTDRLAQSLVDRARMRRRARAIIAYSRAATSVLALSPVLAVSVMCAMLDGYAEFLLGTTGGNMMLASAVLMIVAGLLIIQRLARIEPQQPESVS